MPDSTALIATAGRFTDPLVGGALAERGVGLEVGADGRLRVTLGFPARGCAAVLAAALQQFLAEQLPGTETAVDVGWDIAAHVPAKLPKIPGVKNVLAVASGKGGVGKSTVAVNLALALAAEGAQVGILDADIYGPSQPRMLGKVDERPTSKDHKKLNPIHAHGLQAMSLGFLVDEAKPMVWRGPMATQALMQLANDTLWDGLDYLVVDLPPGTGDIQLSLAQRIPVAGAVIVTTPQDIALTDARKGLEMFRKVAVPVLGVVENMSIHICSNCGHREAIFGEGGAERLAREAGTEVLGHLPLDIHIREQADGGNPTVVAAPESANAQAYRDIARRAAARLAYGIPAGELPEIELLDD
ncbi:MAG: iron-sulfur cluster carrier protein ApbC [Nevskiaceae bacterium]|nr:MAG: iron-sulfur cluster carrier protein ApbC [Nevskiaceae bacterium]TBR73133.1 MAG: iron-sulfur cluster carrier protein ApbC [Nevskiaceae bacterium]